MLLPVGFRYLLVKRGNEMDNEDSVFPEENLRSAIYNSIDKSLFLSFVGGAFLGVAIFFFGRGRMGMSSLFFLFSLVFFFVSRYFGLNFLFNTFGDIDFKKEKEEEGDGRE